MEWGYAPVNVGILYELAYGFEPQKIKVNYLNISYTMTYDKTRPQMNFMARKQLAKGRTQFHLN